VSVAERNARTWTRRRFVRHYLATDLRPVEARLLDEHAEAFGGRVLELGCGTGRVTGHLAARAAHVDALDISAHMLDVARDRYPQVAFHEGDMTELSGFADGAFDAVVAPCNVIDVLDDARRRALLRDARRLLAADGVLVFSSHNRARIPLLKEPWQLPTHDPLAFANAVARLPVRMRNHRRLQRHAVRAADYDILNDSAHDWSLLQYYISPAGQRGQLADCGLELEGCFALDGTPVDEHDPPPETPELHYVARPV
jgi:SAM-dependent methyltransferase